MSFEDDLEAAAHEALERALSLGWRQLASLTPWGDTYEGFTQPMVADATPGATELLDLPRDGRSRREATLSYVLSH